MIIAAFDPGRVASYSRFNTQEPHRIELGKVEVTGIGRTLRPCSLHLNEILAGADVAVVEAVGAMPKQGVSAVLTFGLAYGTLLGAIQSNGVQIEPASAAIWKRANGLINLGKAEGKSRARAMVTQLFPYPEVRRKLKAAGSHGMAETVLMTRWYLLKGPGRDIPIAAGNNDVSMIRS